jgi:hypothetical protein
MTRRRGANHAATARETRCLVAMRWHVVAAVVVTAAVAFVHHCARRPAGRNIGRGPGPACTLPPRTCVERCDELVEMPASGPGYFDHVVVEESIPETSTSFIRRDLMMLVQYAAAKVACKAAAWNTGIGGPIALGDMSHRDGSTPGEVWGMPRHPASSHVDGLAIDIAYYQRNTPNNNQRAICPHVDATGKERWRCLAPPTHLDEWRTALFIGAFLEEPRVRVIGIDGKTAKPILDAFAELCRTRWIEEHACKSRRISYETRRDGRGWFYGHHNHLHVAWSARDQR